ncbi:pathogenesis-related protein STH-21-like [Nicotiana tomentosiformis]|uniref:pathogenesis-related protein STH-21-like n=1 Tax=Nicotiana tomentosiformis TaxID=4098 RepID=UPI00051B2F88|nr:pathogenesis-related protein STH-21-like [Nicotiana tomentosiformis]
MPSVHMERKSRKKNPYRSNWQVFFRIHVVDDKNLVTKCSVIEGDVVGDKLESISYDSKFEATGNGGCICKTPSEYQTKGDYVFKEEEHNEGKDKAMELFKAVENYLLANPFQVTVQADI